MPETEAQQLQAAIAALESQRPTLGDAVVDAALTPIREKLAALEAQAQPAQQRKLASVLFADVSGFTALSETMDAEVVAGIMNDLWALVDRAITGHGGRIDKHIGDAVMALWGAETAREDDPERAVRGALAMQAAIEEFCVTAPGLHGREEGAHGGAPLQLAMRVGVNTGPVLLGQVGTTGEFTAMGDAVNLASRLEHAAPVGGVLVSHDTYRHIRGVFDVITREPLTVKGKAEPVQTYLVQRAKPRAFRMATRGVEGIETRMIGREAELLSLQTAYQDAVLESETRVVTIIGEAGVGKSRLLYEFDNWVELRPERVTYFKGRGTPNTRSVPYGVFHSLFAFRFNISINNLGKAHLRLGDPSAARQLMIREAWPIVRVTDAPPFLAWSVVFSARILAAEKELNRALALFGLIRTHPLLLPAARVDLEEGLAHIDLPPEQIEAGLAAGEALDFDTVVQEILDGKW
jgi:class 3 adenylate cyclase